MASGLNGNGWLVLQNAASCGLVSSCLPPDVHSSLHMELEFRETLRQHNIGKYLNSHLLLSR